jgi:hypothetical protein
MSTCRVSRPKAAGLLLWWLFTLLAAPIASAAKIATKTELTNSQPQAVSEMLVPEHFHVPDQVALPTIKLLKVDPAYAEQDYQALMAARLQIRQALGSDWPADNLTLAENKASLVNDLNAFNQRTNFTYHLLDPASGQLIGCLYISQSGSAQYQATVYYWLIPEFYQSSAHPAIRAALTQWISSSWPFSTVDYSFLTALLGQPET